MYRASYNSDFKSIDIIYSESEKDKELDIIPLGFIDASFDYLNEKNISNKEEGIIIKSTADLFLQQQATLIAPLKKWVASTSKIIYTLPSEYIILKNNRKIKRLEANFDNGQNVVWIENGKKLIENVEVSYEKSGHRFIKFKITFDDETLFTQISSVDVRLYSTNSTQRLNSYLTEVDFVGRDGILSTIPFRGYNEDIDGRGRLEYRVYYNERDNDGTRKSIIRKPIVVLDGFDPGDERKIYPNSIGYNGNILDNSIYELMKFTNSSGRPDNIVDLLRSAAHGYDVILVNFQEGADYIERNAMAVIGLLERINGELRANGSDEGVVLIGPSMGGLISRYALTYMEKNNMNHNTRLWVSFDSPHWGANIPLGAQTKLYFFGDIARQEAAREKFNLNFRSPAARQMLIEQLDYLHERPRRFSYTSPYINYYYPTNLFRDRNMEGQNNNSPFREKFMNVLEEAGFPNKPRKIALVNGTTIGTKVGGVEGQTFLNLEARAALGIRAIYANTRFLGAPSLENQLFNVFFRTSIVNVIRADLTRTNINPRGCMDIVQGGTYNTAEIIEKEFSLELDADSRIKSYKWSNTIKTHSFIPTVSSLALYDPNFDWNNSINRNLICTRETPFDSYYSPETNEEHVDATASSVEWLLQEIEGNPQAPNYTITENNFSFSVTSKTLCIGDRANLEAKVKECELPSEITWVVSSNLEIIQQNSFSVDVKVIGNGEAFIKATFQGGAEYTKTFWVGVPELNPILECSSDDCWKICASTRFNYDNEITVNTVGQLNQQVTEWQWEKVSTNFNMRTLDNTATFQASQVGYIDFRVRAKNECGWSEWLNRYLKVETCSSLNREKLFKIYPNPTSYLLNIELDNPKNAILINKTEIGIYDLMGRLKKTIKLTDFKGQIMVNDLPKGLYILKINIDGQLETHQVQID